MKKNWPSGIRGPAAIEYVCAFIGRQLGGRCVWRHAAVPTIETAFKNELDNEATT